MHAGIAKPDASQSCCQEHFRLGLCIVRVVNGAGEVFDCGPEGLEGEDVGDGVSALVGRAVDGVGRPRRALVVGDCRPGLQRVAEDVQA